MGYISRVNTIIFPHKRGSEGLSSRGRSRSGGEKKKGRRRRGGRDFENATLLALKMEKEV